MNNQSLVATLSSVTIFAGMPQPDLEKLCSQCKIITRNNGEILIKEQTEATEIYIVLSGRVKVVLSYNDNPVELLSLGKGNCIGEASVIGIQKHSATVIVTEDAEFLVLSRQVLMDLYTENKDIFAFLILNIARELARRLYNSDKTLLAFMHR